MKFDGPVAPLNIEGGNALQGAIEEFDKNFIANEQENIAIQEVVDFEHLNIKDDFADEQEEDDIVKASMNKDMSPSERKRLKDKQRKKILVKRQKQEQQRLYQHRKVREEGKPFQKTVKVPRSGWYRFCIQGTFHQVSEISGDSMCGKFEKRLSLQLIWH